MCMLHTAIKQAGGGGRRALWAPSLLSPPPAGSPTWWENQWKALNKRWGGAWMQGSALISATVTSNASVLDAWVSGNRGCSSEEGEMVVISVPLVATYTFNPPPRCHQLVLNRDIRGDSDGRRGKWALLNCPLLPQSLLHLGNSGGRGISGSKWLQQKCLFSPGA